MSPKNPGLRELGTQYYLLDGQPRPWYERRLPAEGGAASSSFPTALNDPPGPWKLEARDIATGVASTAGFSLTTAP